MPEWKLEESTSDPGSLARDGGLRAMLDEIMANVVSPRVGGNLTLDGASKIFLAGHSGGYYPMSVALRKGRLPRADDVLLLDALYGGTSTFVSHARSGKNVATLFTSGDTERQSRSLAESTSARVETSGQVPSPDQWRRPVLVAKTSKAHSFVPLENVQAWLQTRTV